MKQLEVKVEMKTDLKDLVEGFLFCTDRLDKIDEYIQKSRCAILPTRENGRMLGQELRDCLTEKGKNLLQNNLIDNPNPHTQLFNQMQIRIQIKNTTRAVLQEFARHRVGWEITVKSTRYALHKIAEDERIPKDHLNHINIKCNIRDVVSDYYYIPELNEAHDVLLHDWIERRFEELYYIKHYKSTIGLTNDVLKMYVNDYMLTDINLVCSAQALKNFLTKRLSKRAFPQIQTLAQMMYKSIPDDYKFLFDVFEWKKFDKPEIQWVDFDEKTQTYRCTKEFADTVTKLLSKGLYYKQSLTEDL